MNLWNKHLMGPGQGHIEPARDPVSIRPDVMGELLAKCR